MRVFSIIALIVQVLIIGLMLYGAIKLALNKKEI